MVKHLTILLILGIALLGSCKTENESQQTAPAVKDAVGVVKDAVGSETKETETTSRRSDTPFWDYLNLFPIETLPFELTAQSLMQVEIDPMPQKYVDKFICDFNPDIFKYTQCNGKIDNLYPFARIKLPDRDYELLWILQDDAASTVPSTKPNFSYICTYSKKGELLDIKYGTFYGEIECTDVRVSEFYEVYEHLKSSPAETEYLESVYALTKSGKIKNFVAFNEGSMQYYLENLPKKYKNFTNGQFEFSDPTQYDSITDIPRYFAIKHGLFEASLLPTENNFILAISNTVLNEGCTIYTNYFLNYNGSEYEEVPDVFPSLNFYNFYREEDQSAAAFEGEETYQVAGYDLDLSKVYKNDVRIGICNQGQMVPKHFENEMKTVVLEWDPDAGKFIRK